MGEHLQQLGCFAAVGKQQADVFRGHNAQITVQGIEGIEEQGHQADGRKRRCDLAGHDAALADTGDHELRFAVRAAFQQGQGGLDLVTAESFSGAGNG